MRPRARPATFGAWALVRWQRSLQLRVAATTLVVSGVVVLIVGLFIVTQVTDGVLNAKRDAAIRQATVGLNYAKSVVHQRRRHRLPATSRRRTHCC